VTVELYVGAVEEVEAILVETAFCRGVVSYPLVGKKKGGGGGVGTLGNGKEKAVVQAESLALKC